jgi:predicted NAD/FAD-binding protein
MQRHTHNRLRIAVIGTGISGLSAAWLLSQRHSVSVFERNGRVGGHSNTVDVSEHGGTVPVDTGFVVFNASAYPNLTALFDYLGVATQASDMSLSVSLDDGALEYSGGNLRGLFAQRENLLSARFWSMLRDIVRFYREAPRAAAALESAKSPLGAYLSAHGYGQAFQDDHLLPMAAAIWSAPAKALLDYPAAAFLRFYENHGLLRLRDRPIWRTVVGGSRTYVAALTRPFATRILLNTPAAGITRVHDGVLIHDGAGRKRQFDHVVVATHADQAVALLRDSSAREQELLGAFRYTSNAAILHSDASFMPKRRAAWASWNYTGYRDRSAEPVRVTYWMNRLHDLKEKTDWFVTLNPSRPPSAGSIIHSEIYEHPRFDTRALSAQRELWSLQGERNTWFCGAHFGAGFHEDGLQSGLAVAEELGGVRRPWTVDCESNRIFLPADRAGRLEKVLA